ncbi:MAG: ComEC/Rec2 family competence protein [Candidatus Magasanikbacteria bacterium]|nr:ComEC/Rec2 family competence protein [Candidatus Magasanikbacteria bacterium]
MTFAQFSGHLLLAFLLGVSFAAFSNVLMVTGICCCLALYIFLFRIESTHLIGLLLCCCLGIWRFESASLGVKNLVPFKSTSLSTSACVQNTTDIPVIVALRTSLSDRIQKRLPGDEGALLAGTLYGERGLSSEMKLAFRNAGMTHLVAVSGSNLSIIAAALFSLLGGLALHKRSMVGLLFCVIVLFILFVGLQAPVVRAGIMAILAAAAPLTGRFANGPRLLLVSCALFVFFRPCALFFDPAFALSFFATWGLMSYGAALNKKLEPYFKITLLRSLFAESTAASLMTMPYAAWAFGQVSLLGLISNLFAVPIVPWAMSLGSLCLLLPEWTHSCTAAKGSLSAMLWIAKLADTLPYGVWQKVLFRTPSLLIVMGILIFYAQKLSRRHVDNEADDTFMSPLA